MFGPMHELAARRGDGLRPEFQKLFAKTADNVIDLEAFRPSAFTQAGPNPRQAMPEILPSNVVLFSPANSDSDAGSVSEGRLAPRIGRAKRLTRRRTD